VRAYLSARWNGTSRRDDVDDGVQEVQEVQEVGTAPTPLSWAQGGRLILRLLESMRRSDRIKTSIRLHFSTMRTTLTLDDDVAADLRKLSEKRKRRIRELVNQALRIGLAEIARPRKARRGRFRTPAYDVGRCRIGNLDNVSEVLSIAEGDDHK
jgi:hypothetical protein